MHKSNIIGLESIITAINNMIDPAVQNAKFDKTYRAVVSAINDSSVTIKLHGKEYQIPNQAGDYVVGQVVKVKIPLNNFSDIYIEGSGTGSGSVTGDTLPIGSVIEFPSNNIPDNWLLCNGQEVSREEYSELFRAIGTTWGAGNGKTTFNLPTKEGLVTVGQKEGDTDFYPLGKTGGEKQHTLIINEMPSHNHTISFKTSWGATVNNKALCPGYNGPTTAGGNIAGIDERYRKNFVEQTYGMYYLQDTGGNQPHNNLQPYVVSNYIIKAKQSAGIVATVVDDLSSTSATNALSANQGRILYDKVSSLLARFESAYHVGKIILDTTNVNPATYLGFGTWVLWGSGRVPVGVDTSQAEFNAVEKTGGEKKHTLTVSEMPSHNHMERGATANNRGYSNMNLAGNAYTGGELGHATSYNGGSQPHNNLQPYITCYMWKRVS